MSCSSALYACNQSVQPIAASTPTQVNFGSAVRCFGHNCVLYGGNVSTHQSGYYHVNANLTVSNAGTAVSAVSVQLFKDGIAIPGAEATVSVAASGYETVPVPCIIRNTCCCESVITAIINSTEATSVTNAAIEVMKI